MGRACTEEMSCLLFVLKGVKKIVCPFDPALTEHQFFSDDVHKSKIGHSLIMQKCGKIILTEISRNCILKIGIITDFKEGLYESKRIS